MTLEPLLSEDRSRCRVPAASRKRVLQALAATLARPNLPEDELFDGLLARERLGSTGLGEGVAIPHCRADVEQINLCLLTTHEPVDYEAIDGQRVDVFVALIVPTHENEAHLRALAELSTILAEAANRERLRACSTNDELYQCMRTMLCP